MEMAISSSATEFSPNYGIVYLDTMLFRAIVWTESYLELILNSFFEPLSTALTTCTFHLLPM